MFSFLRVLIYFCEALNIYISNLVTESKYHELTLLAYEILLTYLFFRGAFTKLQVPIVQNYIQVLP